MKKKIFTLTVALFAIYGMASANVIFDEIWNYAGVTLQDESVTTFESVLSNYVPECAANRQAELGGYTPYGRSFPESKTPLIYKQGNDEFVLSELGNKLVSKVTGIGGDIRSRRYFNEISTSGDKVYLSLLFSPGGTNQTQSNGNLIGLDSIPVTSENKAGQSYGAVVWVGKPDTGSGLRFGVTRGSTTAANITWGANLTNLNATYLLVLEYTVNQEAVDANTAVLYLNPTLGGNKSGETPYAIGANTADTRARGSICNVMLRMNGATQQIHYIGGIRLSTTWAEAVAIKEGSSIDKTNIPEKLVKAEIYSITGQLITTVDNPDFLNISVAPGSYIAKAYYENGDVKTAKFIKK